MSTDAGTEAIFFLTLPKNTNCCRCNRLMTEEHMIRDWAATIEHLDSGGARREWVAHCGRRSCRKAAEAALMSHCKSTRAQTVPYAGPSADNLDAFLAPIVAHYPEYVRNHPALKRRLCNRYLAIAKETLERNASMPSDGYARWLQSQGCVPVEVAYAAELAFADELMKEAVPAGDGTKP